MSDLRPLLCEHGVQICDNYVHCLPCANAHFDQQRAEIRMLEGFARSLAVALKRCGDQMTAHRPKGRARTGWDEALADAKRARALWWDHTYPGRAKSKDPMP